MPNKPFSLLVKPAGANCNLKCEYCFYLEKASLYQGNKNRMNFDILEKLIASFLDTKQVVYSFAWQGGEPSLMGIKFFEKVIELQKKYGTGKKIENGFQTNATLITDELALFFAKNNFLLGVSLDGPRKFHDKYRKGIDKSGSYDDVLSGIEKLKKHNVEFNVLTLVNSSNVSKGKEIYRYLCEMGILFHQYIPCVEFDNKGEMLPFSITGKDWGNFLCEIFDEWYKTDTKKVSIRLFDAIIEQMVFGNCGVCTMSGNCTNYFVVESNGDVYPCDFFVDKDTKLGNISTDTWENLQNSNKYIEFGDTKGEWDKECNSCEYLTYCSGDCIKHRIYDINDTKHLSWLCAGWKNFYKHTLHEFKNLAQSVIGDKNKLFIDEKFDRNEPCFCLSGKKYKKCHGVNE